ncbi:MAG: hypothetical protein AB1758_08135 [Candidatus Eremiobacterota bacterium]
MRQRGVMLVVALLICTTLLVLGIGFMSQRVLQYRGAYRAGETSQALALARAGLEDARLKLERDFRFPPPAGDDQNVFTYTERLLDMDDVTEVGRYTVTVDVTQKGAPYWILRITSVGSVGPPTDPVARHKLYAEIDVSSTVRGDPATPNPELFDFVQVLDLGGL